MRRRYDNDDSHYFTRDGRRIPKQDALDARGVVRDGISVTTPLFAMDHRSVGYDRGPMRVTDSVGRSGSALSRPGFRCLLEDDAGAYAKAEARRRYQDELTNAWRTPANDARKITRRDPRGREEGAWEEEEENGPERQTSDSMRGRDAAYRDLRAGFGGSMEAIMTKQDKESRRSSRPLSLAAFERPSLSRCSRTMS